MTKAAVKTVRKDSGARFEPVARSAFRTLGLAASASQAEVFEAAEALRLSLKLGVEKKFVGDLPWLGAAARTEADVRDAEGRLADPPRRAAERLFWFQNSCTSPRPATVAALLRDADSLAARGGPAAGHDAALLLLAALHVLDPKFKEAAAWARAFALWHEAVEVEEFWSQLVAADLKGEFEQVLTFAEAAELRARTPRLVSKAVADEAARAVAAEDFPAAGRAFAVLRASLPRPLVEEYENDILGPFEESVEKACDGTFARVRLYAGVEMSPASRKRMFDQVLHQFDRDRRPELMKLLQAAGSQGFHLRRALRHAAEWLNELAGSYRHQGWTPQAAYVYREALALAPPDSAARAEAEEALRELGEAAGPGRRTEEEYAAGVADELWRSLPPAKLFASYMAPTRRVDDTFGGCVLQIAFYAFMVVSCFVLNECGVINTRRRTYPPGLSNYNFRVPLPQLTPFPVPTFVPYSSLPTVTAAELSRKMRRGQVVVVDVRDRGEYDAGHIAGALSVPEDEARERAASLRRRGRQVVCYGSAANTLAAQIGALSLRVEGLKNVAVLDGGFEAWVAEGLPTEVSAAPPAPPTVVPRAAPTPAAPPPAGTPKPPAEGP